MIRNILKTIVLTGALVGLLTHTASAEILSPKKVQKLDRVLNRHKAVPKRFRTQKEYQQRHRRTKAHLNKKVSKKYARKTLQHPSRKRVGAHSNTQREWYPEERVYPRGERQHGYRHFKRGWYLAYRYDRASFYDRYGYKYGYFNQNGFYFDGVFYGYDRYYRYRDRARGKGLFERSYYMPADAARYGFALPHPPRRPTPRPLRW